MGISDGRGRAAMARARSARKVERTSRPRPRPRPRAFETNRRAHALAPKHGGKTISRPSDRSPASHCNATIPNVVVQTWHKPLSQVPAKVIGTIRRATEGFKYEYYTDDACISFLRREYSESHADVFRDLPCGAHKADFFRYCYLYKRGGVYMDIDLEALVPLRHSLRSLPPGTLVTCLDAGRSGIFQAFLAAPPRHPIFPELIAAFFAHRVRNGRHGYDFFTHHMAAVLKRRNGGMLRQGGQELLDGSKLYLMAERPLSRFAPLHQFFVIRDGEAVFRSRYEGYQGSELQAGASGFS